MISIGKYPDEDMNEKMLFIGIQTISKLVGKMVCLKYTYLCIMYKGGNMTKACFGMIGIFVLLIYRVDIYAISHRRSCHKIGKSI